MGCLFRAEIRNYLKNNFTHKYADTRTKKDELEIKRRIMDFYLNKKKKKKKENKLLTMFKG